jgi:hypothetical protein
MRLVVDVGDGKTIEIPVKGHPTLDSPSQAGKVMPKSQDVKAEENSLNGMRGWLMTVATLFVGISFQAMNQRPTWMPEPNHIWLRKHPDITSRLGLNYVVLNTATFSISLVVVVMLVLPDASSPKATLHFARGMMVMLAVFVSINFSLMISKDRGVTILVNCIIWLYGGTIALLVLNRRIINWLHRRRARSDSGGA